MKKLLTVIFSCTFAALAVYGVFRCWQMSQSGLGNGTATRWNEELQELSDQICADASTDKDKIDRIYRWVIENIEYDYSYDEPYQSFDVSKTLDTRKGLCFDYANLFAALCRSQNIRCFVIDGYARHDSMVKHTWNRVYFDGSWWNADLTSDAISLQKGKTLYGFHQLESHDAPDEDYVITRIY